MATYLDRLSMITNEEADDNTTDKVLNEYLEQLNSLLFNYKPFVCLVMNYNATGIFDINVAKQCILYIWRNSNGIADIATCCRTFVEALDNIEPIVDDITKLVHDLMLKYKNL